MQTLPGGVPDPMGSSTHGLGQALRAALDSGARRIVLALGGSASTDGGAGMLAALGARFFGAEGERFDPSGGTLARLERVDLTDLIDLSGIELLCATDVRNPLLGATGAAAVFGPQKGASAAEIVALERGLARLVGVLHQAGLAADVAATSPGSGAAGGAGFGCLALGATVVSGADYFLDLLAFDAHAAVSDLVITGEGALDASTASGKVVSAVVARSGGTPVVAVVGRNDLSQGDATGLGLSAVYSTSRQAGRDTAGEPELTTAALTAIGAALAREFAAGSPP
jgi:glycerate kinase